MNQPMNPIEVIHPIIHIQINQRMLKTSSDELYGIIKILKLKKSETTDNPPSRDERFDIQYIIQSLKSI